MTDARPACADHRHPEWWTAEATETTPADEVREQRTAAAYICRTACPVRDACIAKAEAGRTRKVAPGPGDADNPLVRPFGVLGGRFYNGSHREPVDPRDAPTGMVLPPVRLRSEAYKLRDNERRRRAAAARRAA